MDGRHGPADVTLPFGEDVDECLWRRKW